MTNEEGNGDGVTPMPEKPLSVYEQYKKEMDKTLTNLMYPNYSYHISRYRIEPWALSYVQEHKSGERTVVERHYNQKGPTGFTDFAQIRFEKGDTSKLVYIRKNGERGNENSLDQYITLDLYRDPKIEFNTGNHYLQCIYDTNGELSRIEADSEQEVEEQSYEFDHFREEYTLGVSIVKRKEKDWDVKIKDVGHESRWGSFMHPGFTFSLTDDGNYVEVDYEEAVNEDLSEKDEEQKAEHDDNHNGEENKLPQRKIVMKGKLRIPRKIDKEKIIEKLLSTKNNPAYRYLEDPYEANDFDDESWIHGDLLKIWGIEMVDPNHTPLSTAA